MLKIIQLNVKGFDNNFSYIIFEDLNKSRECVVIDPTGEKEIIENALKENNLSPKIVLLTHLHPDHTELTEYFESKGVEIFTPKPKSFCETDFLEKIGLKIKIIHTPGHTKESVCYQIGDNLFSGDTLFVRGVGTTAYGGNNSELEETLAFLSTLNQKLKLWPGHNYGGNSSTLKEALNNSHLKPSKKILELIKKKVEEYNKKCVQHKKF